MRSYWWSSFRSGTPQSTASSSAMGASFLELLGERRVERRVREVSGLVGGFLFYFTLVSFYFIQNPLHFRFPHR